MHTNGGPPSVTRDVYVWVQWCNVVGLLLRGVSLPLFSHVQLHESRSALMSA